MKKAVSFFFLFSALIYWFNDGFVVDKVLSELPHHSAWNTSQKNLHDVKRILDQEFTYLDKGHQAFVFESQDQKYVLKLINHSRFSVISWMHLFPLPDFLDTLRQVHLSRKNRKYRESFESFALAMNELAEETATVYVQLNRSNRFEKPLVIYDKLMRRYEIDLNNVEFILQKKVQMLYPALQNLLEKNGKVAFRQGLSSFLDAIFERAARGISDDDLDVCINMGMLGTRAYIIDTGRFFKEPGLKDPDLFTKEIDKSIRFFVDWLESNYPEEMGYFDYELKERLVKSYQRLGH